MKRIFIVAVLIISFALLPAYAVFAASSWEELVAGLEKREAVRSRGSEFLAGLKMEAPQGAELDLWKMLWVGGPRDRAAAGVALMDRIFPGGDPGRWEYAGGFMGGGSFKPRQLAGMDAFFVTVAALDAIDGGEWAAAFLLDLFSNSARGMTYFIDQMPRGLQAPIASVVAKTGISGNWSPRVTRRPLPLLPVFGGNISRGTVESRQWQYLDGSGRIAGNGYYAWDRDRGYLYQVTERSDRFWWSSAPRM